MPCLPKKSDARVSFVTVSLSQHGYYGILIYTLQSFTELFRDVVPVSLVAKMCLTLARWPITVGQSGALDSFYTAFSRSPFHLTSLSTSTIHCICLR
jgi:hypothetical protein